MMSDLTWEGRLSHSLKAPFPIVVTPFGILMLTKDLQVRKALSPIFVTLSRMLILVRESQPSKAPYPIPVTQSGMLMVFRDLHLEKAKSPILVTLSGMLILVKELQL